jgi:hypothetical protein
MGLLRDWFMGRTRASGGGARKDSNPDFENLGKVGGGFGGGGGGGLPAEPAPTPTGAGSGSPAEPTPQSQTRTGGGGGGARRSITSNADPGGVATNNPAELVAMAKSEAGQGTATAGRNAPRIEKTKPDKFRDRVGNVIADTFYTLAVDPIAKVAGHTEEERQELRATSRNVVRVGSLGILSPSSAPLTTGSGQALNIGAQISGGLISSAWTGALINKGVNWVQSRYGTKLFTSSDADIKAVFENKDKYGKYSAKFEGTGNVRSTLTKRLNGDWFTWDQPVTYSGKIEGLSSSLKIPDSKFVVSVSRNMGQASVTATGTGETTLGFLDDAVAGLSRSRSKVLLETASGTIRQTWGTGISGTLNLLTGGERVGMSLSEGLKSGGQFVDDFSAVSRNVRTGTQLGGVIAGKKGIVDFSSMGNTLGLSAPSGGGQISVTQIFTGSLGQTKQALTSAVAEVLGGTIVSAPVSFPTAQAVFTGNIISKALGSSGTGKSRQVAVGVNAGGSGSVKTFTQGPAPAGFQIPKMEIAVHVPQGIGGISYPMENVKSGGMWATTGRTRGRGRTRGQTQAISQLQIPISNMIVGQDVRQKQAVMTATELMRAPATKQKQSGVSQFNFDLFGAGGFGKMKAPVFGGFGFDLGRVPYGGGFGAGSGGGAKAKYTPSLGGIFFGKKGQTKNLTGAEIRGMPKKWGIW